MAFSSLVDWSFLRRSCGEIIMGWTPRALVFSSKKSAKTLIAFLSESRMSSSRKRIASPSVRFMPRFLAAGSPSPFDVIYFNSHPMDLKIAKDDLNTWLADCVTESSTIMTSKGAQFCSKIEDNNSAKSLALSRVGIIMETLSELFISIVVLQLGCLKHFAD